MTEAVWIMERPLAMRQLHEAQITETRDDGLVTAGNTVDHYYPGEWQSGLQRAVGDGRKPWAVFAFRAGHFDAPLSSEFDQHPELLRVTACLETKGVLQLRVYRCAAGRVEECPLRIVD
jgi:hypothetical protein